jgi:two-component sensor histidine kinase
VTTDGTAIDLSPRAALCLTMALGELATNAAKYGALASEQGTLSVSWRIEPESDRRMMLNLEWQERGGPPVESPTRRGFGVRLIERCIAIDLGGVLDLAFRPDGVCCRMSIPVANCAAHG